MPPKTSGAGQAMEYWDMLRSYPDGRIHSYKLQNAFESRRSQLSLRNGEAWQALGPKNVGGRTLCLAFHPKDPDRLYAGSASGGLWVSHTGGRGPQAWERVRTGYPVLGVGAIAINPDAPDEIFIGTGEVYNYRAARPGIDDRFNRGSYGMGILRSLDGGKTWTPSLDWRQTELRGVWRIVYNPLNSRTILAATTEGVFRSQNSGDTWQQISARPMAVDLEIHSRDTNVIYVSHGAYYNPESGIYRSTDGGASFQLLSQLPNGYTGKAMISLAPSEPDWIYVSMAEAESSIGLFRSIDRGKQWTVMNDRNVAMWQGWFAHDVAVNAQDPQQLIYVGIDSWRSFDGGRTINQLTYWQNWSFGPTPLGGPEGPANYVHADIHGAYYHPVNTRRVFLVTDGGIFESVDGGTSWTSRNGGYQTQQFYAEIAGSAQDSNLLVGGLQDNGTVFYTGSEAWARRVGGDGMSAAIDPQDDHNIYASLQSLHVRHSADRGETFRRLTIGSSANEVRNFSSPYVLAPSQPSRIYAGAQHLYRSDDRGENWTMASGQRDRENAILKIAVAPDNPDLLYLSTNAVDGSRTPAVFKITNGGRDSWVRMTGLPEQLCADLVFHPTGSDTAFAVFGGFNNRHVFRTMDGGDSWTSIDNNLPDLPTHCLFVDPAYPEHLYVGNDLGVFASRNDGQSWEWISGEAAEAMMVMDLNYSPTNRKLRVATHGSGIYQFDLDALGITDPPVEPPVIGLTISPPYPNPSRGYVQLDLQTADEVTLVFELIDVQGRILERHRNTYGAGTAADVRYDLSRRAPGVYWIVVRDEVQDFRWTFRVIRV